MRPGRDLNNPLCIFGDRFNMTPRELGFFFELDEQTIRCYQADEKITDEWVLDFCRDPMMDIGYLEKRVKAAMMASYLDLGVDRDEAEDKIRKRLSPLRRWRKEKALTQEAAAQLLGITSSALSRYEVGNRPTPKDILNKIKGELA